MSGRAGIRTHGADPLMGWGKAAILIFVQIIIILVLVPSAWMERVIAIENRWLGQQMGTESAGWVRAHSEAIYDTVVVDSGLLAGTYALILPTEAEKRQSGAMSDMGSRHAFPYARDRLRTTFLVIHQSITRAVVFAAWAPFALLVLTPAVVDGLISWRIRKTTFHFASPTANHFALAFIGLLATALVVALLAPFPVPPLAIPAALLALTPALYIAVSHTSKRL